MAGFDENRDRGAGAGMTQQESQTETGEMAQESQMETGGRVQKSHGRAETGEAAQESQTESSEATRKNQVEKDKTGPRSQVGTVIPGQKNQVGLRETGPDTRLRTADENTGKPSKDRQSAKKKKRRGKLTGKQKIVRVLVCAALVAGAAVGVRQYSLRVSAPAGIVSEQKTAVVERRNIISSLSSSGSLAPKDTYNIMSLVSGDVVTADFEEGDQVTEGQVLYVIDGSSVETELNTAQNSVERARTNYELAQENYNQAVADYSGNTYKSTESGFVKTLYVKAGDKVSAGTRLADIYNNQVMKLKVPFLSSDAVFIGVGNDGLITMSDTGEQIGGKVTAVGSMEGTLAGGRLVRYVTLEVANPGGLTEASSATVQIGDFICAQESTFEPSLDTVMSADISGSVEIAAVLVNEGDYIGKGSPFFRMTDKTAENLIRTYKNSMDQAQESLESSQNRLTTTQDSYENYTITAPISGTVITKNTKAGDKINAGGNNAATLAVIYDLSQLTFEMSVDELDVSSVAVGQSVEVTADAFEGQRFSGKVTNISLASSYSNGVTNYPVTVTLEETGRLLPGMNVDGNIILEQAENTLVIPVDSLMRGNRVYVKDESVTESDGPVPAGFRAVEVETGLMNDDYVEILSGLSEGDEVYVSESSQSGGFGMMPGGMGGPGMGGPGGGAPGGMGGSGGNRGGSGGAPSGGRP